VSQQYSIPQFWATIGAIGAVTVLGIGLYMVYNKKEFKPGGSDHSMQETGGRIPSVVCKCQNAIDKMKELYKEIEYAGDLSDLPEPDYYYYMVIEIANALKSCNVDKKFLEILARRSTNVEKMADFLYKTLTSCGVSIPEE
jgi:hypothetical protein